jgi:hypothetical protein
MRRIASIASLLAATTLASSAAASARFRFVPSPLADRIMLVRAEGGAAPSLPLPFEARATPQEDGSTVLVWRSRKGTSPLPVTQIEALAAEPGRLDELQHDLGWLEVLYRAQSTEGPLVPTDPAFCRELVIGLARTPEGTVEEVRSRCRAMSGWARPATFAAQVSSAFEWNGPTTWLAFDGFAPDGRSEAHPVQLRLRLPPPAPAPTPSVVPERTPVPPPTPTVEPRAIDRLQLTELVGFSANLLGIIGLFVWLRRRSDAGGGRSPDAEPVKPSRAVRPATSLPVFPEIPRERAPAAAREGALILTQFAIRFFASARAHLGRSISEALQEAADALPFKTAAAREGWLRDLAGALEVEKRFRRDDLPALGQEDDGGTWPPGGLSVERWLDERAPPLRNLIEGASRELPAGAIRDAWLAAIAEAGGEIRRELDATLAREEPIDTQVEGALALVRETSSRVLAAIGQQAIEVRLHEMASDDPAIATLSGRRPYSPLFDQLGELAPGTLVRIGSLVRRKHGELAGVVYFC